MDNNYPYFHPEDSREVPASGNSPSAPERKKLADVSTKTLAVIGVVALLMFAVWGVVQVVRVAPGALTAAVSSITSIFVPADSDSIAFDISTHTINADEEFTLNWSRETGEPGTYLFTYACREGVSVEGYNTEGIRVDIECDTPFQVSGESTRNDYSFSFIVFSETSRFVDLPVTVTFVPTDSTEATAHGSTLLTIVNQNLANGSVSGAEENGSGGSGSMSASGSGSGASTVAPGTGVPETHIIPGTGGGTGTGVGISDPLGTPDLSINVIATGRLDKTTSEFTPFVTIGENERAAVRFEVRNVGTKETGVWSFIADLPTNDGTYVFRPDNLQRSLFPGERIEYTLGFDAINRRASTTSIVINLDTARAVSETNRGNNSATAVVPVVKQN